MHTTRWRLAAGGLAVALAAGAISYAVTEALRTSPNPVGAVVHGPLKAGSMAPSMDLRRLSGAGRVELSAFRGQPVVVNFFASWCTNCRAELGAFARMAQLEQGSAHFLGVDSDDSDPGSARALLRSAGATYPVGTDPNGVADALYDVPGLPTTFVLDARGRVVVELVGQVSSGALRHWITAAAGR